MDQVIKERKLLEIDEGVPSYEYSGPLIHSTRSFNEKNDKIYDQHYDYSNAENKIIDCVNDKCLAEIFMYLPACERPKLALVCKKWKKVLDNAWYDVKKLEFIYWRWDEYSNCLAKYPTSYRKFDLIDSLLQKCGRYLTKLDVTALDFNYMVLIIEQLCPNLVTLCLRFTDMNKALTLGNIFTDLSKLKSLTIIFQNLNKKKKIPVTLIESLRNVADTLTDLSLLNWIDGFEYFPSFTELMMNVIPDLKALKRFETAGVRISQRFFDWQADSGILYFNHTSHLTNIIPTSDRFNNITVLNMMKHRVKDETLYTIANTFKHLKFLEIQSRYVTDNGVVAISKMNNLRTFNFYGSNNTTDSSVKLLKNMINLRLPSSTKITDDSVMKVLENSPNMVELDVSCTNVTAGFVKKAAELSNNRKQRLIFCVSIIPDIQQYESPYFEIRITHKKEKNHNTVWLHKDCMQLK